MFCAEADDVVNVRSAGLEVTTLSSRWGEHAQKQAKQVDVALWRCWDRERYFLQPRAVWANTLIPYSVGMKISIRGRWRHGSYPNSQEGNYKVTLSPKF